MVIGSLPEPGAVSSSAAAFAPSANAPHAAAAPASTKVRREVPVFGLSSMVLLLFRSLDVVRTWRGVTG